MPALDVELTPPIADALYVGLITDTGRFSYENTGPRAHRMAAELIEAGVDVAAIYRRIYEGMPYAKLELLRRALQRRRATTTGSLAIAFLTPRDYAEAGAEESYSEGIIDHLRAVEGTKVAALVRELLAGDKRGLKKVSLRATGDDVDVSAIARAHGGGGHRRAAGFTTELETRRSSRSSAARLAELAGEAASRRRPDPRRQAGGHHLPRHGRPGAAGARQAAASATPARSTRSPPAC